MNIRKPRTPSQLDEAITSALSELNGFTAESEEYAKIVDQIAKLHEMKDNNRPPRVSKDALITAGASLLGIIMIVAYEDKNVLTSKAVGFVPKLFK